MERIKMACPCGATMETESNYGATVDYRQKWFQEAHSNHLDSQQETPAHRHSMGGLYNETGLPIPYPPASVETPASETSSAPMTGPATRLSQWSDASHASKPEPSVLMGLITDFFRSTSYTEPELEVQWNGSSTLRLTLRWPTQSGESKAGDRGPASPEVVE